MTDWRSISQHISEATGSRFRAEQQNSVGGGCINTAYSIADGQQKYFVKLNNARQLPMFVAEAEGLQEILDAEAIKAPRPICYGATNGHAYLVLENIGFGRNTKDGVIEFGQQLALMHRHTQDRFGWHRDNTIGSTPQPNEQNSDWVAFWQQQRLGFQLDLAAQNGVGRSLREHGERLIEVLPTLFSDYRPAPSLLHGDLWSGNYAMDMAGHPVIYDPAVYYGDREADLAMTELFGSLPPQFYSAYGDVWPIDAGYHVRKILYNLYHILNHYNLFGGGYSAQAGSMIKSLLSEAR